MEYLISTWDMLHTMLKIRSNGVVYGTQITVSLAHAPRVDKVLKFLYSSADLAHLVQLHIA